ncbi:MAG: hypothetical protein M1818_004833 [Claussenomyces sp. TS43310]|nr:MAG: hypothetical protein M1818_004833 [Claussenomyces sp. TS43310]
MNINEPKHGGFVIPGFNSSKKARRTASHSHSIRSNRLPFLDWVPDDVSSSRASIVSDIQLKFAQARNHFVATSAEFAGTTLFLIFAFAGTQVALLGGATAPNVVLAPSNPSQLMYIALSFGFSLAVNAWVFFRISGGLFNPAVTLGMCLVGALPYLRGLFIFVAQILGGITAAAICSAILPGELTVRTSLGGGTSIVQGLFIEMFLTAELVFTIFMLAAEKHKGTFIAPVGIGLSLFIAELMGVYFTGGSVNPARSLGPAVVDHKFNSYHWIYWVGPILGSLLASGFYKFIKMLEYETVNPGQDATVQEGDHFNPDLDSSKPNVSFAPDEYGRTMEEGQVLTNDSGPNNASLSAHNANNAAPSGKIGNPLEYGSNRRPYSDSPAPPHKNDQFAGVEDGGMHARDYTKPHGSGSADSDGTLIAALNSPPKSTAKVSRTEGHPHGDQARPSSKNTYANIVTDTGRRNDSDFYDEKR